MPSEAGGRIGYHPTDVPARSRLEELLAALRTAREDPTSQASLDIVRRALDSRIGHAAAKAAALAGRHELAGLVPDLIRAFGHFLDHPKDDPGCAAKAAIAEALYRLGHDDPEPFLRGVGCVQLEPVYGGRVDTALDVRGASALGLVRCGHRDALLVLAELLADPEAPVRISAARAVAYRGGEDGAALLRLKVATGDEEPRVLAECLLALLRLDPGRSLPFAVRFLDGSDAMRSEAALVALGESRLREAFGPLRAYSERAVGRADQRAALAALAALRRDEAVEYLVALVGDGAETTACAAIEALGAWRDDERVRERVREAVAGREEPGVKLALARVF
jgi:HEAT repeat protein